MRSKTIAFRWRGGRIAAIAATITTIIIGALSTNQSHAQGCRLKPRIVGGYQAELQHWPGFAALRLFHADTAVSIQFCGGSAVTPEWVVTAAHCFDDLERTWRDFASERDAFSRVRIEVVLGTESLDQVDDANIFQIERWLQHDVYREARKEALARHEEALADLTAQRVGHDIALVKLARPWSGPLMRISLAPATDPASSLARDNKVLVVGFGSTAPGGGDMKAYTRSNGQKYFASTPELLEVALPLVATQSCKLAWPAATIGAGHYCAGFQKGRGKDSCNGDSGGPLISLDDKLCPLQIGLVSWGPYPCAPENKSYSVYTRVSAFATWLRRNIPELK